MSNRNASASAAGWNFQANAAILLMLENIKEAEKVRVEGEHEDIEIFFKDKFKIYSQVKFVEKPDDYSNVLKKLKAALETLNDDAAIGDGKLYTYITNSPNPFNDQKTMAYFTGRTHLYFKELPNKAKIKIRKIMEEQGYNNLDTNKFDIRVIPFYGNDPKNRYKEILEVVVEFLMRVNVQLEGLPAQILEIWQRYFSYNATQSDKEISIDKKKMIWALIVLVTDRKAANDYQKDFGEDEMEEIEHKYRLIINNETVKYQFFTKVISDHMESKLDKKTFIKENWWNYLDEIKGIGADDAEEETLTKIIIHKILSQREYINNIKKGTNL